MKIHKISEP